MDLREDRKNDHGKKMVAPIVITVIMIVYYIVYFGWVITLVKGVLPKVLLGIIPVFLGGAMIYVCVQRIREIKGGEEDDLSQY